MKVIFDNGHGLRVERNENGLLYVGALADLVNALACKVEKISFNPCEDCHYGNQACTCFRAEMQEQPQAGEEG